MFHILHIWHVCSHMEPITVGVKVHLGKNMLLYFVFAIKCVGSQSNPLSRVQLNFIQVI